MYEKFKLKMTMRKLFTDHTIWTRMFIVDLLNNSPSIDYTIDRLLKNQEAVGNCIKPYFGDIAGDNLTSLLKEHVIIMIDLLKTIKERDITKATTLEEQWVANAENMSTFLSTINPCYAIDESRDMCSTNLILVKYQFIARMGGDYNADIMYFDMGFHHVLMLSDYLSKGIIERFFEEETMSPYQIYETQEQISQEQISQEQISQEQISQEQISQEQISQEQISQEQISQEQISQEQISQEQISQEQISQEQISQEQISQEQDQS